MIRPNGPRGGDWSAWKSRLPIKLAGLTGAAAALPIDVTFTLKAAECPSPEKEIRLIYHGADGRETEVPCQLSRLRVWDKGLDPKVGEPTLNGMITFFDISGGGPAGTYFLLYGNPAAPAPVLLRPTSPSPAMARLVIENGQDKSPAPERRSRQARNSPRCLRRQRPDFVGHHEIEAEGSHLQ